MPLTWATFGCDRPKEVRAWPGMPVSEFNRVNRNAAVAPKTGGIDWIGVNAPVTPVLPRSLSGIRFTGETMGGGMQITSTGLAIDGRRADPPIVDSMHFDMGKGLESIMQRRALLTRYCNELAAAAGVARDTVPGAATISDRLQHHGNVSLCQGSGETMVFQLSASNEHNHWWYGHDYRQACLHGFIAMPEE